MNNHTFNYVYPPDFEKAHRHRQANRIFKGDSQASPEECQCCGKRVGEQQVQTSCSMDPTQFSFMGPGVPLFFLYLKFIVVLLVVMSVFFMGFAIFSNVTSSDCGTISSCVPDLFNTLSLINKQSKSSYMEIQSYLGLTFVILCILLFHYFRYSARKLIQECDQVVDSPSDYAIILRRLPNAVTEDQINQLIQTRRAQLTPEDLAKTCDLKVNKIVMSYRLGEYNRVKEKNMENFKTCVKEERIGDFQQEELPKPIETSSIAIVVFESQAAKDYLIHKPTLRQKTLQFFCTPCIPLSDCQIRGQNIGIQRAPEPDEIHWENSGITMKGAISRKTLIGSISVVVLLVGGGIQYGLSLLAASTEDTTTRSILTTLSSLIVTVFNVILMLVLGFLTKKERNETETEDQTVLMVKVTLFQFLNAGVFVVMSEIAANYSTFSLNKGICSQITLIMILNAIVPNFALFLLDYTEIINRVLRFCVARKWLLYSQAEVNQLFIGSSIELPFKYAYILKTLWLTAVYSSLIPVVVGVSALGLGLFYAVEKFLYTRAYCMPSNVSSMSYQSAVELLEYFLITFSIGELIIYYYFYNFEYESVPLTWTASILATVCLAVLNSALPMEALNDYLFPISPSSKSELTYSEVEPKFEVTYEMTNPAYETKNKRNHFKNYLGVPGKANPKGVTIQMVNLFEDTKNNESLASQKPLLQDFLENQAGDEQKESDLAIEEEDEQEEEGIEEKGDNQQNKGSSKNDKVTNKTPKNMKGSKDMKRKTQSPTQKSTKKNKIKTGQSQASKLKGKAEPEHDTLNESAKKTQREQQPSPQSAKKPRKYVPKTRPPVIDNFELADPFQDLSSFKRPTFVIRWQEKQAQLQRQRAIKEKEEQRKAAILAAQQQEQKNRLKLAKLSQQAPTRSPLSPSDNLQNNLENVYANLLVNNQSKEDKDIIKPNPVHIMVDNVPICSKYFVSGGKLDIYEQYIESSHNRSSIPRLRNRAIVSKKSQRTGKQLQQTEQRYEKTPKAKNNHYKFVVIKEVPLKSRSLKKQLKFAEESVLSKEREEKLTFANIQVHPQNNKNLKSDGGKDISEAYRDAFGKSSHMNSRSSLHASQDTKAREERKAIYNPIPINGGYKNYFKNKYNSQDDIFEGFLDKKTVMGYIGTPFSNLAKTMPHEDVNQQK